MMSNKDLKLSPRGIEIYHRTFDARGKIVTKKFLISWARVESAVDRKRKK